MLTDTSHMATRQSTVTEMTSGGWGWKGTGQYGPRKTLCLGWGAAHPGLSTYQLTRRYRVFSYFTIFIFYSLLQLKSKQSSSGLIQKSIRICVRWVRPGPSLREALVQPAPTLSRAPSNMGHFSTWDDSVNSLEVRAMFPRQELNSVARGQHVDEGTWSVPNQANPDHQTLLCHLVNNRSTFAQGNPDIPSRQSSSVRKMRFPIPTSLLSNFLDLGSTSLESSSAQWT